MAPTKKAIIDKN